MNQVAYLFLVDLSFRSSAQELPRQYCFIAYLNDGGYVEVFPVFIVKSEYTAFPALEEQSIEYPDGFIILEEYYGSEENSRLLFKVIILREPVVLVLFPSFLPYVMVTSSYTYDEIRLLLSLPG